MPKPDSERYGGVLDTAAGPIRGAVVGLGVIGRSHLRAYADQERLQIVGLVDPLGPRDAVPASPALVGLPCFPTLDSLLASEAVDFIDICSPPHTHADYICQGLSRGLHVICEKPVVYSSPDIARISEELSKRKLLLFPAHNYRHAPGIVELQRIVSSGALGAVQRVRFRTLRTGSAKGVPDWWPDWRRDPAISGGGVLRDHGPHSFYVLRFITGLAPQQVSCQLSPPHAKGHRSQEVEESASLSVQCEDGVTAVIELTWAATQRATSYEVICEHGSVSLVDDDLIVARGTVSETRSIRSDFNDTTHWRWIRGMLREFTETASSTDTDLWRAVGERALQEAADVAAAYQSAARSGAWMSIVRATAAWPQPGSNAAASRHATSSGDGYAPSCRRSWQRIDLGAAVPDLLRTSSFPQYAYGIMQAAFLAQQLGIGRIAVAELGVAGGNGLLEMERLSEAIGKKHGLEIVTVGFDRGSGMPPPLDHRDMPHIWRSGFFTMNESILRDRLSYADLRIGEIEETGKDYLAREQPPLGFVSFDLDYYSSTVKAMDVLLCSTPERYLPRLICYFDDTVGPHEEMHTEFTGELLAIKEFNAKHDDRKIGKINGLRYKLAQDDGPWAEGMYLLHLFSHSRYNDYVYPEPDRQFPLIDRAHREQPERGGIQ